jgi:hypothetical protein
VKGKLFEAHCWFDLATRSLFATVTKSRIAFSGREQETAEQKRIVEKQSPVWT